MQWMMVIVGILKILITWTIVQTANSCRLPRRQTRFVASGPHCELGIIVNKRMSRDVKTKSFGLGLTLSGLGLDLGLMASGLEKNFVPRPRPRVHSFWPRPHAELASLTSLRTSISCRRWTCATRCLTRIVLNTGGCSVWEIGQGRRSNVASTVNLVRPTTVASLSHWVFIFVDLSWQYVATGRCEIFIKSRFGDKVPGNYL